LRIDAERKMGCLFHRKVARLGALEDLEKRSLAIAAKTRWEGSAL